ncbi:MAG: AAA family ATPase, partial [bacterium]|nr:AAA family ATPase [bacterium]
MTWFDHFQLDQAPFSKAIGDADLWLTQAKKEAVTDIVDAVSERATGVLLVGDSGLGKSCVLRALRHRLAGAPVRLTYCHNATLGRRDFYRQICRAIGLSPKATAAAVFNAVSDYIRELSCEQLHPVFVIDEAHLLHQDVLDHLHILANHEWDSKPLLTLVLAGLPDLWDRMLLRRNRSLWTRIHTRIRLPDPEPGETVEY